MNMLIIYILMVIVAFGLAFWQISLLLSSAFWAPTVYAYSKAMEDAYELAELKKGETVIDLGCGNARSLIIAAKKYGAKGIGVEVSLYCYFKSKFNVALAGQSKNIRIVFGDLKKLGDDLKKADVVYLYLLNSVLKKIEPWFFDHISTDTRVVVLSFHFDKHKPIKSKSTYNLGKDTEVYLYKK